VENACRASQGTARVHADRLTAKAVAAATCARLISVANEAESRPRHDRRADLPHRRTSQAGDRAVDQSRALPKEAARWPGPTRRIATTAYHQYRTGWSYIKAQRPVRALRRSPLRRPTRSWCPLVTTPARSPRSSATSPISELLESLTIRSFATYESSLRLVHDASRAVVRPTPCYF